MLLPKDNKVIDLERLLSEYFKNEILEFETICTKYKKILNHKKELNIVISPKILSISIFDIIIIHTMNYILK